MGCVVLCCVVLCVSFVFGFCCFLHFVWIMVSVEMYLRPRGVMVDGVLIQCLSVICRTLSAFLLSVCTYVCVVYGFNLYVSGCVLVVPKVVC